MMNYENKVIEALCNDERIWNNLDEICEAYGFDSCLFYDEHGRMIDRRKIAEDLVKDTNFLDDYAYRYGITLEDSDIPYDIMDDYMPEIFNDNFYGEVTEKVLRSVLKEAFENDDEEEEELSPFEEYEQGYPNDDFDVSDMTPEQLATWCKNVGDFLYVFEGLRGMSIMAANADNIVSDIVNDLYNCQRIEPSHEVDYLFYNREREFINDYVCIFKVIGTKDGDYYVVYQEDKIRGNNFDLDEGKKKLGNMISETVNRLLMENLFEEQWEEEIQIFLNGLKNGEALIDDGYVAVEWGHNESDPRFIYYKEGEDTLTDDHFSMQHSRRLYFDEIKEIQNLAKQVYGVDIYIPDDEYYDELEDWEK